MQIFGFSVVSVRDEARLSLDGVRDVAVKAQKDGRAS